MSAASENGEEALITFQENPMLAAAGAGKPKIKEDLQYNSHLEEIIASEAEKALVLRWLHNRSEIRYSHLNTFIAIPVICISTLAGTASIGQESLFGGASAAPVVIGMMSLFVSVLNVVGNFFGWAKRAEGHRISGINYAKMHRWISIELALPREQRMPAKHFLKEIREQIDRLHETSPPIPQQAVDAFNTSVKELDKKVSLPEICNAIHNVEVYRGKNTESDFLPSAAPPPAPEPQQPTLQPALPQQSVPQSQPQPHAQRR